MDTISKCSECGYENEPGARFCGNCGNPLRTARPIVAPLPSTLPEEIKVPPAEQVASVLPPSPSRECPWCQYPAEVEDMFCRRCGTTLVRPPSSCPRCGDAIDEDEKFCNRCGLALT